MCGDEEGPPVTPMLLVAGFTMPLTFDAACSAASIAGLLGTGACPPSGFMLTTGEEELPAGLWAC